MGAKNMSPDLSDWLGKNYPDGKSDLMTAFMLRTDSLVARSGVWAMINLPSWMSLKSFESLRSWLIETDYLITMAHLGRGVFGSDFGTVAFCIEKSAARGRQGVYRRLFERHVEVRSVARIESLYRDEDYNRFVVDQKSFTHIPGQPIVYWLSEKMRAAFSMGKPLGEIAEPRQGLATTDNARFTRSWWEVGNARVGYGLTREEARQSALRWFPYNKGGEFRRWYGNQELLVCWQEDGAEVCQTIVCKYPYLNGKYQWVAKNMDTYFLPSVSWSKVSSGAPAFRLYPSGFVYDVAGTSIFALDAEALSGLLAFGDSQVAFELLVALAPTLNYEVGQISSLPVVPIKEEPTLEQVGHLVATSKDDWDSYETSWEFGGNLLVNEFRALTVR